jgi:L-asparaginase
MRTRPRLAALLGAAVLTGAFAAPRSPPGGFVTSGAQPSEQRPRIRILATGGTIVGAQSSRGDEAAEFKVDDLVSAVPSIARLAELTGEQVANIGGEDMNDAVWLKLGKRVNEVLAGDVEGVVITHGTDTMEETAFFLDLVVKSEKPVVLVGSMRPATAVSADGPANLYDAVATAASTGARGRGVLVTLNEEIHAARNVTKLNTTNVDAFGSPQRGPVGAVHAGSVSWFERMDRRHTTSSEFSVQNVDHLPRVDILYAHANMSPDLVVAALQNGAQGLVIAGVGEGHMRRACVELLSKAAQQGIVVVRSTRLPTGMVLRNDELDDALGFVASGELNPPKARVLLQLALLRTKDPVQIRRMFNQY